MFQMVNQLVITVGIKSQSPEWVNIADPGKATTTTAWVLRAAARLVAKGCPIGELLAGILVNKRYG